MMKKMSVTYLLVVAVAAAMTAEVVDAKMQKMEMELYVHVWIAGTNQTEVKVAGVNGTASNGQKFGTVTVMDGIVTEGSTPNTTYVGRCQGIYSNVALDGTNYLVQLSIIFHNAKYNSSTIEIFGADRTDLTVRQVAIIGGTGHFHSASGTLDISTFLIDTASHYTLKFYLNFFVPRSRAK